MTTQRNKGGRKRIHASDADRRRAWRKANPEKVKAQARSYHKRRRDREKMEKAAATSATSGPDPGEAP